MKVYQIRFNPTGATQTIGYTYRSNHAVTYIDEDISVDIYNTGLMFIGTEPTCDLFWARFSDGEVKMRIV